MTCAGDNGECPEPVEKAGLCRGHRERKKQGKPTNTPLRDYGDPSRTFQEAAIRFANVNGFDREAFERAWANLRIAARRWVKRRPANNVPPPTDS